MRRKGALASLLSRVRSRRTRRAGRHADDRQGTRLSGRDAGRRHFRRRRSRTRRLPCGRAHVSAADAGGRTRRERRAPGEAVIQTLYPEHYSIQLACRQDYPASSRRRSRSAAACGIRRWSRWSMALCAGRSFADAMQVAAEVVRRLEARASGKLLDPRTRARTTGEAPWRAPGSVLSERDAPRGDASGPPRAAG